MVSCRVPEHERARALSFIFSGLYAGSVFSLLVAPAMLTRYGWRSIFYTFGSMGIAWCIIWEFAIKELRYRPFAEKMVDELDEVDKFDIAPKRSLEVPWKRVFRSTAVWAIIVAHFCYAWGYFVLLTWFPTYLHKKLGFNYSTSGFIALTPWVAMFAVSNIAGIITDTMVKRGVSVTTVRKGMQSLGFLLPALFLSLLPASSRPSVAVALITIALAAGSFSHSGLYSNHADIAPALAGVLLGITNTGAAIPGIVGVWLTGRILDSTGSWMIVFGIAIGFNLVGWLFYFFFATGERLF